MQPAPLLKWNHLNQKSHPPFKWRTAHSTRTHLASIKMHQQHFYRKHTMLLVSLIPFHKWNYFIGFSWQHCTIRGKPLDMQAEIAEKRTYKNPPSPFPLVRDQHWCWLLIWRKCPFLSWRMAKFSNFLYNRAYEGSTRNNQRFRIIIFIYYI